jgi:GTP cyclohydrolase I
MTRQILVALQEILATPDVAVAITAKHNCIIIRGVKNSDTENVTLALGGKFSSDDVLRSWFHNLA